MTTDRFTESTLTEVCNLVTDGTHDTPRRVESGFPLIKAKEITGGRIDFETCDQISEEEHLKVIARSHPEIGDTLFTHIGASLGEAAYVNTRRDFSIKNIALFKPNPAVIDGRYLYYLVVSPAFQALAKGTRTGSAQPFLGLSQLRSHPIRYHVNLRVQCHIASILSSYDDLVETNNRRIAILEEMARTLYREWFVYFRFPGYEKIKMVESRLGPIPRGWDVAALSALADINARSIKRGEEPHNINYVDIASVSTGRIEKVERLDFQDAPSRARRIVKHGDIIWSTVRPNLRSYSVVIDPVPNLIASTGFAVISATRAPFTYLYYAVTTDEFAAYLANHATGAAYPAVNAGDFESAPLIQPPEDLLSRFHEMMEPSLRLRELLTRKATNLRTTRDLLLPKLISGEIEVSTLSEVPLGASA